MARQKTGGRTAGTLNKVSATVKDNVLAVFNRLGGTSGMAEWANENKTEFYKLYGKMIPNSAEVSGPEGAPIQVQAVEMKIIDPE